MPTDEEPGLEPEVTHRWWLRLWLRVVGDHSQTNEFHSLNEPLPLRMFLVHGLTTTLLVVIDVVIVSLW